MKQLFTLIFIIINIALSSRITFKEDKSEIFIGEQVKVLIDINYPDSAVIDYNLLLSENIGDFEKLKHNFIRKNKNGNLTEERIEAVYTTFTDTNFAILGPFTLNYLINNEPKSFKSDSTILIVNSILKTGSVTVIDSTGQKKQIPLDSLNFILPIKELIKYKLSTDEKKQLLYIAIAIILTILIIWLIFRRKKVRQEVIIKPVKIIPAHIIALEKIEKLKQQKLIEKGEYKDFSIKISLIVREYLEKRYNFIAMELTTFDLKKEAVNHISSGDDLESLERFLDLTDLIKFAKYIPEVKEISPLIDFANDFINRTKKTEKQY